MKKKQWIQGAFIAMCLILHLGLAYSSSSPTVGKITPGKRSCPITSSKPTKKHNIFVMSFNVLAPCWASPDVYSPAIAPYLNSETRRKHIIRFLNTFRDKADIIALQETTASEFTYYQKALENTFYSFPVYHNKDYWSAWISPDIPWEPNGVAIFVKKATFAQPSFYDLALTNDGNHAAYFEGVILNTGTKLRAASIHLDNDLDSNRYLELTALMTLMPSRPDTYDIIAGDFNYGTQTGSLKEILVNNHFIDTLYSLKKEEWTHPFENDGDINSGVIDHIIARNLNPIDGQVINSNVWELYPHDEGKRAIENLERTGSDHFPLTTLLN